MEYLSELETHKTSGVRLVPIFLNPSVQAGFSPFPRESNRKEREPTSCPNNSKKGTLDYRAPHPRDVQDQSQVAMNILGRLHSVSLIVCDGHCQYSMTLPITPFPSDEGIGRAQHSLEDYPLDDEYNVDSSPLVPYIHKRRLSGSKLQGGYNPTISSPLDIAMHEEFGLQLPHQPLLWRRSHIVPGTRHSGSSRLSLELVTLNSTPSETEEKG
ncbi:unnamed protein product [Sphagnum tenellum]